MPAGSSKKRERQYQHIKADLKKSGRSEDTKDQLSNDAKQKNIKGRSKMSKAELEKAVGR